MAKKTMERYYNYLGDDISGMIPRLQKPEFGTYDENHIPIVDWSFVSEVGDEYGFDTSVLKDGNYCYDLVLPKGTMLCRYGRDRGRFTADLGTPYEKLGLPYDPKTIQYHQYEVTADGIAVKCVVVAGHVAPAFDSMGGAVQYMHPAPIMEEIRKKKLKEVILWRKS